MCKVIISLVVMLSLSMAKASDKTSRVMTIAEFEAAIKMDPLLKEERFEDTPLDEYEKKFINNALQYEGKSYGGIFDRNIKDFKGNILVVGGGKNQTRTGTISGAKLTKLEIEIEIQALQDPSAKFSPTTGEKLPTENEREKLIQSWQEKLMKLDTHPQYNQHVLDTYYSLNIDKDERPDFIASITSESDMSKIPDHRFKEVFFEAVDCDVFLDPKVYKILERITAPGGQIHIQTGYACARVFTIASRHSKWNKEIHDYMKNVPLQQDPAGGPSIRDVDMYLKN